MALIDEYVNTIAGSDRAIVAHMVDLARQMIPKYKEQLSYNMPALIYRGKGVLSIAAGKNFMSLFPFCNLDKLGIDFAGFETTKGSLHFTAAKPVSDELLTRIVQARIALIDEGYK